MSDLILYLGMAAIGYAVAARLRKKEINLKWIGTAQTVAIILLIFTMGSRMGANREVMANLNTIGLTAAIMTVVILVFCILSVVVTRKIFGIDRWGYLKRDTKTEESDGEAAESEPEKPSSMTLIILICVSSGLAFGYFFAHRLFADLADFDALAGTMIRVGLCVLLLFVGYDIGFEGTVIENIRKVGFRVLVFPFAIMAGALIGSVVCAFFMPLTIKESLAVAAGFGWYTLAPGIIMDSGLVTASAVSFMHNVMREFCSVLFIPVIAKKIGYLEAMSLPGASGMDVCLPLVERATRSDIAMYSFVSGLIQSAAVPILVPVILAL